MAEVQEITSSQELNKILAQSSQDTVVIFKHSTSCPISARAWQEVQSFMNQCPPDVLVAMIKVIESRPVSNQLAEELGVKHQSPQVIFVKAGKACWSTSHQDVTQSNITKALAGDIPPFSKIDTF